MVTEKGTLVVSISMVEKDVIIVRDLFGLIEKEVHKV